MNLENKKLFEEDTQICLHAEEDSSNYFGSINPPIVMTSLFSFKTYGYLSKAIKNERQNCVYSRGVNPTVQFLEKKIALLERGETAKCFASGIGSITAALFSLLKAGDHVLVINNIYGPVLQYLEYSKKNNISYTQLTENINASSIEANVKENTKLIYFETPGTMMFKQVDIAEIVSIAKKHNILTMTDNSWATPIFQKPITMGVDIVAHSMTKYLGGHSDLIAGVLVTSNAIMERIFPYGYLLQGSVMAPQEAYLLLRSLRTLTIRMKQHEVAGIKVAEMLSKHKKIKSVNHPCLNKNDEALSKKQLYGYSGLFSFTLDTEDFAVIEKTIDALKMFKKGVSWGGFESLAISPHYGNYDPIKNKGVDKGIIRIAIGLEPIDLLLEDLDNALKNI